MWLACRLNNTPLPFHRIWRIPWMGCWGGRRRPPAAEREPTFPSYLAYSLNGLLGRQAAASSCWERTYLSIVSGVFPEWVVGEAGGGLQLLRENLPFHRIWRIPWMGCWGGRRRPLAAERTYLSVVSGVFPEWVVGEAGGGLQLLRENLPFHRIWRIPWMGCWGGRRRPPAAEREATRLSSETWVSSPSCQIDGHVFPLKKIHPWLFSFFSFGQAPLSSGNHSLTQQGV